MHTFVCVHPSPAHRRSVAWVCLRRRAEVSNLDVERATGVRTPSVAASNHSGAGSSVHELDENIAGLEVQVDDVAGV